MKHRNISTLLVILSALPTARALGAGAAAGPDLEQQLAEWRGAHGATWQVDVDAETGYARMLFGGRAAPAFQPRDDADFVGLARRALSDTASLHGVASASLTPERALFLPLGEIGSSDKETVRLRQEFSGVRVVDGFVNVLFDARGALLSIQSTGLPNLSGFDVQPAIAAEDASKRADRAFADQVGRRATRLSTPELVIDQELVGKRRTGVLAWRVDAVADSADSLPDGFTYFIDARDGRVLRKAQSVHTFDVTGTVSSNATPGVLPDTGSNPPVSQIMKYLRVTSAQGNATTDANGNFTIPGVNAPLAVTFTYNGAFNAVTNTAGPAYTLTQTLQPNQSNAILMNSSPTAPVTAQANVFRMVDTDRDFVRSVNPMDATADFVATGNTNLAQTCNAYYDGASINFFAAGGGCPNTAYADVVSHEHGHWYNDLYGTGNGPDGMGEGNADVWAMYHSDNPVLGQDFFGPGTFIRTGLNTRQFCGDANPGCYGEVHADGEVWMGAAWKVRAHLKTTNGSTMGSLIANNLFLGWMNAYNQTEIKSIIETQWLTLDDNDGNLGNTTPHFADINQGFVDQGFPTFVPPAISISGVTAVPDQACEAASYPVSATIAPLVSPPITTATIHWRVNGGSFNTVAMNNPSGNTWTGSIPSQVSPARVEYYLSATDNAANSSVYPPGAPASVLGFTIGTPVTVFSDDFESAGDNGWTHASVGDTSNNQDEWQHGAPLGSSGTSFGVNWTDPSAAVSGTRCWGLDLGIGGSDGAYADNIHAYLRSPIINCTGATATRLRFKRWLTCEQGIYDQARVLVNNTQVWVNPANGNTVDTGWSQQEVDISALADNNPNVRIQFELKSDPGLHLGGWQLDDVTIVRYTQAPPCCAAPTIYCTTSPNSAGPGAQISSSGTTSIAADNFVLHASGCPANKLGLFIYGMNPTQQVLGNGFLCVGNPFFRLPHFNTSASGSATFAVDFNNLPVGGQITSGSTWKFQLWFRDPAAGGSNFNLSNGESATFCP
jgi:hypothetical protein